MQHKMIDYSRMSKVDKVRLTENMVIESPQFKQIIKRIGECHKRSKYTTEPRCLFITGEAGYGKTTIGKFYEKDYPRVVNDEGVTIPVLRSNVSSPATIKSMASWLLKDLGDPLSERGTVASQTMRLCKLIKECRVELIILDEFQHLIDRDTEKVLKSSADWLKHIMNDTGVPIVLMGMPWSVRILSANDQLQRRFSSKMELKAFDWSTPAEQKEFITFLTVLEKALPLPKPSHLYGGQMSLRLFCATRGVISNVKKLISKAVEKAVEKGFESTNLPGSVNPFRTDYENLEPLKRPTLTDSGNIAVGRRGRRKQNGRTKENISSILRK